MTTQYWLMKSEPETYSWADLVRDGKTDWTGVRNFAARGHLKAMKEGDRAFFYHSGEQKAIVGLAEITRTAFPDKTAEEEGWVAVEVKAVEPLARPVTLAEIKKEPALAEMALIRLSRLSVQPVAKPEFEKILKMAKA
jgi:predicted RNA-binding protein with PUA-like domain